MKWRSLDFQVVSALFFEISFRSSFSHTNAKNTQLSNKTFDRNSTSPLLPIILPSVVFLHHPSPHIVFLNNIPKKNFLYCFFFQNIPTILLKEVKPFGNFFVPTWNSVWFATIRVLIYATNVQCSWFDSMDEPLHYIAVFSIRDRIKQLLRFNESRLPWRHSGRPD